LKTVWVYPERIDWVETKLGWLFAWYVWEKGYEGDVTIRRIERGLTPLPPDRLAALPSVAHPLQSSLFAEVSPATIGGR
jgi:hypothetical protein